MNINDLRAEVERRQKAANAKIARLRRKGVQLEGTEFDVRRDPSRVGRYNSRQLQTYLGQLNEFTSRRNSFVAGSEGAPIRAHVWRHYQRSQNEYNAFVQKHYESVADIPTRLGVTVAQFDRDIVDRKARAKGGGVSRPLSPETRQPFEVPNEAALLGLRSNLERKMRPGYMSERLSVQREQMLKAVSNFGDKDLLEKARNLTDEQLDTLWNYTDAPRDLFAGYHQFNLLASGKADDTEGSIFEDAAYETGQWIEWAGNLPPRKAQQSNRKNRR